MDFNKVPPHDIEAEQAVIGSMLTDKEAVVSAIESLTAEDFYREDNKIIYSAILNLYSKGEAIDIITLKSELSSMGKLDAVGGLEYLAELPEKVPTTANVDKYINIIEEKSTLRTLIKTGNEIITLGYDPTQDVEELMDSAEKKIFGVMQSRNQKSYSVIKDILVDTFVQLEDLYNRQQHITGIPTGFYDLDYKTAGLHGSDLILVAARPAMGKSAFALNIATNAAVRANTPVAIFSLEMSKEQMVNRILCGEALVDSNKVRTGKLEDDDWAKLAQASGVIALSQLSRAPEQRPDHRPMLSDLRESGSIEQDADIVIFLYRDDYYNQDSDKKNVAEIILAKHRSGSTGTVELAWLGNYTKFANLDNRYEV